MNNLFIKSLLILNSFFLSLLPITLIVGPAAADINICLVGLIFLIILIIDREKILFFKNKIIIFLFIFYVYILLISLFSANILLSLQSSLFYFRFIFFILSIQFIIVYNKKIYRLLFFTFFFSFSILIFDSFFQYFKGYNTLGYVYDGIRLSSFFNEEKILGSYLSRLTPIFLGFIVMLYGNSRNKIILSLILVILIDILVVLSGERTSIFYMFFSTFLILIMIEKWKIYRLTAFVISLVLATLIIVFNSSVRERVLDKTIDQINIYGEKINTFSIQHQVIYSTAIKIAKDNLVLGIGPKNFRNVCKQEKYKTYTDLDQSIDGCQTHPHNTYIQILTETGIIGLVFIISFYLYITYLLLKHIYLKFIHKTYLISDHNICFIIAIYINIWPFVPTGSFFNNWLSIIYFLPLGLTLHLFNNNKY